MKTFSITTLGCRVNHYESEQLATLLRSRGLVQSASDQADLRIIHTCSVTTQAASKSRQTVRRTTRLPVLAIALADESQHACAGGTDPIAASALVAGVSFLNQSSIEKRSVPKPAVPFDLPKSAARPKVIVTGCWATSHPADAANLQEVDAVVGHHQDVNKELSRLLTQWALEEQTSHSPTSQTEGVALPNAHIESALPEPGFDEVWMMQKAGVPAGLITNTNESYFAKEVNDKLEADENSCEESNDLQESLKVGMVTLPHLGVRQTGHQRAFLKVQDGCDAHCTYCIIPQLRPKLWSKPVDEAVDEARRLVDAGHIEIVLTGIFLGAFGQPTALRRRQKIPTARSLGELVEALCTRVPGLGRLRLSSLEPGDLTDELIGVLQSHSQVVPHFHLPLQSGSDALLRRMNRQYNRDDFLRMADQVKSVFDRPAITTDIIVGFPGETPAEFDQTIDIVNHIGFMHIHAFSYSPRPKTAAARWTKDAIHGPIVNQRINRLGELAAAYSTEFRRQFIGQTVEVLVERPSTEEREMPSLSGYQHGRCERYFAVHFEGSGCGVQGSGLLPGTLARVRVDRVTPTRTFGTLLETNR